MILLDTSVLSRVFRRSRSCDEEIQFQRVVEALISSDTPLGIPGIVLQEVLSGIRVEKQFSDLEGRLRAAFTIVLPSIADHVEAARIRNRCLAKGLSLSGPDCLIAAMTLSRGYKLFTADDDFVSIARYTSLKLFVT